MGGVGTVYCFLSGCTELSSGNAFRDDVLSDVSRSYSTARSSPSLLDLKVDLDGLIISEEDVEASDDFVMICPHTRQPNGNIHLHCNYNDKVPRRISQDNISIIFNVSSGPEEGLFQNNESDDPNDGVYFVTPFGSTMVITHSAYLILQNAAPKLLPHILYRLKFRKRPNIEYGPIAGIQTEHYVEWAGIAHSDEWPPSYTYEDFWRQLLFEGNGNLEQEAWKGAGNMWALVRPDRFPVADTDVEPVVSIPRRDPRLLSPFENIPVDILLYLGNMLHPRTLRSLVSTSTNVYLAFGSRLHRIAFNYIVSLEPWFLPGGPFNIPNGDREIVWWKEQWADRGISGDVKDNMIPWLCYRRACSHSMSMWNRIRIWRVIKQLENVAEDKRLIK